jgi:hypothetical protein
VTFLQQWGPTVNIAAVIFFAVIFAAELFGFVDAARHSNARWMLERGQVHNLGAYRTGFMSRFMPNGRRPEPLPLPLIRHFYRELTPLFEGNGRGLSFVTGAAPKCLALQAREMPVVARLTSRKCYKLE